MLRLRDQPVVLANPRRDCVNGVARNTKHRECILRGPVGLESLGGLRGRHPEVPSRPASQWRGALQNPLQSADRIRCHPRARVRAAFGAGDIPAEHLVTTTRAVPIFGALARAVGAGVPDGVELVEGAIRKHSVFARGLHLARLLAAPRPSSPPPNLADSSWPGCRLDLVPGVRVPNLPGTSPVTVGESNGQTKRPLMRRGHTLAELLTRCKWRRLGGSCWRRPSGPVSHQAPVWRQPNPFFIPPVPPFFG